VSEEPSAVCSCCGGHFYGPDGLGDVALFCGPCGRRRGLGPVRRGAEEVDARWFKVTGHDCGIAA